MRTDAAPILAHLVGDYILQADWEATTKISDSRTAALHAVKYTLPFLVLTRSPWRLAVIGGTHFAIDRWRLAKHVAWAKNQLAPAAYRPGHTATGYRETDPDWMAVWLMILTDNTMHLLINAAVLEVSGER